MSDTENKLQRTEAQWRDQLGDEQYQVCREKGTERAFTGKYWDSREVGTYTCAGCGEPLFSSQSKYDAGCGWPSFSAPSNSDCVSEYVDSSAGMMRTEVVCSKCDTHLGHVFPDGPPETGLRYCINSVSLGFDNKADKD